MAESDPVREIVAQLGQLQVVQHPNPLVIVLPLKPGAASAVRRLLEDGPPVELAAIPGLERHEVYLTPNDVIVLFEPGLRKEALETLLRQAEVGQMAAEWRQHLAGPPQVAEQRFAWERPEEDSGVHSLPTPGPGDSDGGDIF